MKKYYDLYEDKIVAELDWKAGYGSLEDAKNHLKCPFREVDKTEYKRLEKIYCKR